MQPQRARPNRRLRVAGAREVRPLDAVADQMPSQPRIGTNEHEFKSSGEQSGEHTRLACWRGRLAIANFYVSTPPEITQTSDRMGIVSFLQTNRRLFVRIHSYGL